MPDPLQQWIADLLAAGWTPYRGSTTVWQAPDGTLYRGPYAAWQAMRALQFPTL